MPQMASQGIPLGGEVDKNEVISLKSQHNNC